MDKQGLQQFENHYLRGHHDHRIQMHSTSHTYRYRRRRIDSMFMDSQSLPLPPTSSLLHLCARELTQNFEVHRRGTNGEKT